MPKRLFKSPVSWAAFALGLLYYSLAMTIPISFLVQIFNGIFVGMSLSIFAMYVRSGWNSLRLTADEYTRADQYTIGEELIWIGMWVNRGYAIYLRTLDQGGPFIDSHWVGVFVYLWIIGGVLKVTAPGLEEGMGTGKDKWFLYISIACGAMISIALILAQGWGTGIIPPIAPLAGL